MFYSFIDANILQNLHHADVKDTTSYFYDKDGKELFVKNHDSEIEAYKFCLKITEKVICHRMYDG